MRIERNLPRSRRVHSALVLVEVVAAIVLLSTVACGLLVAHSRSLRSLNNGLYAEQAAELARELILEWKLTQTDVAVPDEGILNGKPRWSWERRIVALTPRVKEGEWVRIQLVLKHHSEGDGSMVPYGFEWIEGDNDDESQTNE